MLLEQYQEAEAALLEGLGLEPRHEGMVATMATVAAALEPEPASPTSPAFASTPKRSAPPPLSDALSGAHAPVLLSGPGPATKHTHAPRASGCQMAYSMDAEMHLVTMFDHHVLTQFIGPT